MIGVGLPKIAAGLPKIAAGLPSCGRRPSAVFHEDVDTENNPGHEDRHGLHGGCAKVLLNSTLQ